jgi:alpha-glucosidase
MDTMGTYAWWQDGIIYEVYARSFQDTDRDGVGDIQGILSRLDYLEWLGISVVWLSPVYPSPMKDFGYDISDYISIDPLFGSLSDFDRLVRELHDRDMKLILDLVPNHSSDQHPWFAESRSSSDNPKSNWYIWSDPAADGGPPNNWLSVFGGSAWEWEERRGQYYYHAFLKEQPDLNYREPRVVDAMHNVMRFWLKRGVDGFRVDVMWHLIKDQQLKDNPINPDYEVYMPAYHRLLPVFSTDQQEVHEIVHTMRNVLDEFDDRVMIGEIYLPVHRLVAYYGIDNPGAHLPFNFLLLQTPWDSLQIASVLDEYFGALPKAAWPNWVLGNHDQPRIRSRVGLEQSRIAAILLLTLFGTPTLYYGDEIGMRDVPIPENEIQDPQGLNMPGKNLSRDPARTPMQWDASPHAGFTSGTPWLRIDKSFARENVAAQKQDPASMLTLYRKLIALRQREPALKTGSYERVFADRQGLAYVRKSEAGAAFLIVLNLTHRPCYFYFKDPYRGTIEVATAVELENTRTGGDLCLSGDEGIVVRLD